MMKKKTPPPPPSPIMVLLSWSSSTLCTLQSTVVFLTWEFFVGCKTVCGRCCPFAAHNMCIPHSSKLFVNKVWELAMSTEGESLEDKKLLEKCAATTWNLKLVGVRKSFLQRWRWMLWWHLVKLATLTWLESRNPPWTPQFSKSLLRFSSDL